MHAEQGDQGRRTELLEQLYSSPIPVHFTQWSAYNVPPCPSYVPIPQRYQAKC